MPASLFDSPYYRDQFSTPAMREVFSDTGRFESWLETEAALARAEARVGVIPAEAADAITAAAQVGNLDPEAMKRHYDQVGFAIVPLVRQLGAACPPEAARYVRDSREPLRMTLITNEIERSDGVIIPLQYSQSVGVSKTHPELLGPIEQALLSGKARIDAILTEEGIPLLPSS